MKKILVTASTFPRYMEDTEPRFIYDLCKEYTKYYDVTVLVPAAYGAKSKEDMEGMHVIRYNYFPVKRMQTLCYPGAIVPRIKEKKIRALLVPFLFWAMYRNIKKYIKECDIIHANWIIPQGIVQYYFDKPYIISGLGGDVTSINKGIIKKMKYRSLVKAKKITVVSKDLKKYLIDNFKLKETDIEVIPMGCNLHQFSPANRKENYWNQGNKKVILFVGRLAEKKGAEYLIRAMRNLNAKLVIVGDGPEKEKLMHLAEKTESDIEFAGAKNKQELSVMYASCDIFCIPSVVAKDGDKEGLPVALIEAMASGAAVVGTAVGGISEVLIHKKNGLVVLEKNVKELESAISLLLNNDELRSELAQEARKSAEKYDFIQIGKRYKKIIDEILE